MKEKFIKRLYNFWEKTDDNKELLLKEITDNINNGVEGIEVLLDWCRNDFDNAKDKYRVLHNLSEEEMEKVIDENYGNYQFMYGEIDYIEELDFIWDLCNWYLDYLQDNNVDEEWFKKMIERG